MNPSLKVAVADDDPDMREILVRFLVKLGHEVCLVAADGADLLQGVQSRAVDLIVTDLDVPILDGLAAAEELAKFGAPVILVSGHADLELIRRDREPIVTALQKPLDIRSLEWAIALAISGRNRQD